MEKRDYYEVLGVSKDVTPEELKKAYRKKAIQYHPDRQQGKSEAEKKEAEEKFKEAAEAYDVLSNPEKRARYDQFGHNMGNMGGGGFSGGGMSMEDIFSQFGDIFGGFSGFGGFGGFGGSSGSAPRQNRGTDLRVKVKVTLKDVAHGVEKKLKIPHYVACSACHGTGAKNGTAYTTCSTCHGTGVIRQVKQTILGTMQTQGVCPTCGGEGRIIQEKCAACGGEGVVRQDDVVTVNIPAGVAEGMTLSMKGKGNAARNGGVNGDLLVVIEEEPDKELQRDGNDLVYSLFISVPDAILGTTAEIPSVDGKLRSKLDPGTQSGKILRLRGKGIPDVNGYGVGDMLVYVQVWIPKNLSSQEKEAMEKMRGSKSFDLKPSSHDKNFFDRIKRMFS